MSNISIDERAALWQYLSDSQKNLVKQGIFLIADIKSHVPIHPITDYSYVVFPVAKAYEGFLKQLFLDLHFITQKEYESDHYRIGKVLSPHLVNMLRNRSMYRRLTLLTGNDMLARLLWDTWKRGRNKIFHYFPHNLAGISLEEAETLVQMILDAMEKAVKATKNTQ